MNGLNSSLLTLCSPLSLFQCPHTKMDLQRWTSFVKQIEPDGIGDMMENKTEDTGGNDEVDEISQYVFLYPFIQRPEAA